jgi:hypothetical protein
VVLPPFVCLFYSKKNLEGKRSLRPMALRTDPKGRTALYLPVCVDDPVGMVTVVGLTDLAVPIMPVKSLFPVINKDSK